MESTLARMSLFKDFPIKEKFIVQFRAKAFNVFNHPQFGQPNASVDSQAGRISPLALSEAHLRNRKTSHAKVSMHRMRHLVQCAASGR